MTLRWHPADYKEILVCSAPPPLPLPLLLVACATQIQRKCLQQTLNYVTNTRGRKQRRQQHGHGKGRGWRGKGKEGTGHCQDLLLGRIENQRTAVGKAAVRVHVEVLKRLCLQLSALLICTWVAASEASRLKRARGGREARRKRRNTQSTTMCNYLCSAGTEHSRGLCFQLQIYGHINNTTEKTSGSHREPQSSNSNGNSARQRQR